MNKMNIFEAIDLIDDDLIREADISSETSSNRTEEEKAAISVSGVEVRSGIRWQRIAALASAFILIAVFGAVGALLYKNRPPRNIEPSEILIPPATESTSVTEAKQTENTESAITNTKMAVKAEEKETKESTNTASTDKIDNKAERVNCYSDEKDQAPEATEPNESAETPKERKPAEPATTAIASCPTTQKPVTTARPSATTAVKTTAPKVTEAPTTTEAWVIHLPCTKVSNVTWREYQCPEMFEILRSIEYRQITAAEFAVTEYEAPNTYLIDSNDNNRVYALNFDHKWIMRYGTDGTDLGDAPMPDRLYELFCCS